MVKSQKYDIYKRILETFQSFTPSIRFKMTFTTLQTARSWFPLVFKKLKILGRTATCKAWGILSKNWKVKVVTICMKNNLILC